MTTRWDMRILAGTALAVVASAWIVAGQTRPDVRLLVIVGGTLIDGTGDAPRSNDAILLENGHIKMMGPDALRRAPREARVITATDQWIVPGFIDGHVHFFQTGGLDARPDLLPDPDGRPYAAIVDAIRRKPQAYLRSYVCAGVTSVVDFGGPSWIFDLRSSREADPLSPRIAFAGPLLATFDPKPLEIENDEPLWLMKDEAGVAAMVDKLAAMKTDFVKIWWVKRSGDDLAAQERLVRAAMTAAHGKKLRVAVHATTTETASLAVEAGADILVHSVSDDISDALVQAIVARKVIYVPTLIVSRSYREVRMRGIAFEPIERECAPATSIASFDALAGISEEVLPRPTTPDTVPIQQKNLKRLADAGAIIAAGTDAGNTRTLHGSSLHREFVLMREAGLSPMQILTSATANGARLMGRESELGVIKPGHLADLLVLDADPLADIANTRKLAYVIRGGSIYHR